MSLNPRLTDWQGKRVWLVGASSGIGLACARALREAGAIVTLSARAPREVLAWSQADPQVRWRAVDVSSPQALATAAQALAAEGPLDLVLYCAGHYQPMRADELDLTELLRHDDRNYRGALRLLDAVLPILLRQGHGHLSLVSSVAGWHGLPQSLAYGPTKAALTHLAEVLWLDLQPRGIGVSVIHPGFVATPLTAGNAFAMPALMQPPEAARAMLRGWARGQFNIQFPRRFTFWLQALRLLPYRWSLPLVRRMTGL